MKPRNTRDTRAGPRLRRRGERPPGNLDDLRRLVLGPERQRIDRLEQQLQPNAEAIASVLPEAVSKTTARRSNELAIALEPPVTDAVRAVAHHEPDLFGEILAPTIGAAVRKAVGEAMSALMQQFDATLEQSFSLRSVRWRIEARRTGRPFAEVVLLRTLVYHVEQVLLIQPQTGLLLEHVFAAGVPLRDPDQVAAMVEAIEAFVREAFRPEPAGVHLSSMQVGDLVVWVDRDPFLAVAAVVRGVAPHEFGELLRDTRERIYIAHQSALAERRPKTAEWAAARPMLERCLRTERRQPPRRARIVLTVLALLAALALVLFVVRVRARAAERAHALETYVEVFEAEPGFALTSARHIDGRIRVTGFRDPLAPDPVKLLERRGLARAELRFEAFHSLDPEMIERRARRALGLPAGVTLAVEGTTLRASGSAPRAAIERARLSAKTLPGIERYDDSALRAEEAIAALRESAAALQQLLLRFARGSSELGSAAGLARVAAQTREVLAAAAAARTPVCVVVVGHSDATGTPALNQRLREQRALHTVDALVARGIGRAHLRPAPEPISAASAAPEPSASLRVEIGTRCTDAP